MYAMVCRESLLRYTDSSGNGLDATAMVCRESLLRYTSRGRGDGQARLWFAGNRF